MKFGTYSQINNYMMIYDNPRSRSFIDICPRFNIFKLLSLRIIRQFEAKFHMKPPWDIEMKMCSTILDHMTKPWLPGPYIVSLSKRSFFGTKWPMILKFGVQQLVLKNYQKFSNDDTGLTLTMFMTRSNLFPNSHQNQSQNCYW